MSLSCNETTFELLDQISDYAISSVNNGYGLRLHGSSNWRDHAFRCRYCMFPVSHSQFHFQISDRALVTDIPCSSLPHKHTKQQTVRRNNSVIEAWLSSLGTNDSNQTLNRTFWALLGHSSLPKKMYSYLRSFYSRDFILTTPCAKMWYCLYVTNCPAWDCTCTFTGNPRWVPKGKRRERKPDFTSYSSNLKVKWSKEGITKRNSDK